MQNRAVAAAFAALLSFAVAGATNSPAFALDARKLWCKGQVSQKNLKTHAERAAEKQKCMADPDHYK